MCARSSGCDKFLSLVLTVLGCLKGSSLGSKPGKKEKHCIASTGLGVSRTSGTLLIRGGGLAKKKTVTHTITVYRRGTRKEQRAKK